MADRAEQYYLATQWQLMWRKFRRHRLALLGGGVLLVFYLFALLAQFVAPTTPSTRNRELVYAPPQRVRLFHEGRLVGPFIYPFERSIDPLTTQRIYTPNKELVHRIRFFVRGEPYRFWGSLDGDLHLFHAGDGRVFLLGTDELGRDLFSRILAGSRVSLTIGLVGVMISFVLGCLLGGISGYFGGLPDLLIQRLIEIFNSIPGIPLWMALSAVIPVNWPVLRTYFTITLILSVLGWTGVARVVRGKLLELREYDYVTAARLAGTRAGTIIATHLLPGFLSYLIAPHPGDPRHDPGRDGAQLPGSRHPAAGGELGNAAARGAERDQHRHLSVAADPGAVRDRGGTAVQLRRRRAARCRRPLCHERPGVVDGSRRACATRCWRA